MYFAVPVDIVPKFQKTEYWCRLLPNFTPIGEVPVDKTMIEQKTNKNIIFIRPRPMHSVLHRPIWSTEALPRFADIRDFLSQLRQVKIDFHSNPFHRHLACVYQELCWRLCRPTYDWGPALAKFRTGRYALDWSRDGNVWTTPALPRFADLRIRPDMQSVHTLESFA